MKHETKLGKIQSIRLGPGGYQDAMFGVSFQLGSDSWGVGDFWGTWSEVRAPEFALPRQEAQAAIFDRIRKLMEDSKVPDFSKLKGIPVEVEIYDNGALRDWRVLTEVL